MGYKKIKMVACIFFHMPKSQKRYIKKRWIDFQNSDVCDQKNPSIRHDQKQIRVKRLKMPQHQPKQQPTVWSQSATDWLFIRQKVMHPNT